MVSIRATSDEITRRLTTIENSIKSKLDQFYKKKILPLASLPIESIKRKYESQVKTIIRVAVEKAYLTGTEIVGDKITDKNKDFQLFISVTDAQNIQQLTNKLSEQFWKTTSRLIQREKEFIFDAATQELEKKKSFDATAAMIGLAVSSAFIPYNNAVISKMQQTVPITTAQPISTITSDNLLFEIEFGIEELDTFNLPLEGQVMFLTQEDAKVDPDICEPLNRTVYDVNDPSLPIPIEDTHIHCRCRLLPIISESDTEFIL